MRKRFKSKAGELMWRLGLHEWRLERGVVKLGGEAVALKFP